MTTKTVELQHLDLLPGDTIPDWVDPDTFISPNPSPLPDAMHEEPRCTDVMITLRRHLRKQPNWETTLISGRSHFYYDRANPNNRRRNIDAADDRQATEDALADTQAVLEAAQETMRRRRERLGDSEPG